jgi:hypothetical protein
MNLTIRLYDREGWHRFESKKSIATTKINLIIKKIKQSYKNFYSKRLKIKLNNKKNKLSH